MRGGARVKEALGFVTLLWNHPVLTGLLLLIFTPPFFPLLVYFSPLLMSTALCVVALVSVGSQMEKIKAEGGPGQQLESHLAREHGVSSWSSDHRYGGGGESNRHGRSLYANIHVVPATPPPTSWQETSRSIAAPPVQLENRRDPQTPDSGESDEDWWDTWVKEYESRPGWGEQEDPQPFRTPARIPTDVTNGAPAKEDTPSMAPPLKPETENLPVAVAVVAPLPVAPAPASVAAAPVSVSVVKNRQEAASRTVPATSTSRSPQEEVVVSVKVTDYVSTLAPIRTGRETVDQKQGDRIGKTPQEILKVDVPAPRVSDVQALQSIEKLLHMEIGATTPTSRNEPTPRNERRPPGPGLSAGKGISVEAASRDKVADQDVIAGEPPLLRHLKTSRSESKHSRNSSVYSPLPGGQRSRGGGVMAEKVQPPPQFSPRLLQSLQPLPPGKSKVSPRPLPNSSAVPLGNPVEKIPQWVYDGIPKERADKQAMKAETAEEKNIRKFEQAVKVLSYTRRRTHARRSVPIPADTAKSSLPSENSPSELLPTRTEDNPATATERAQDPRRTDSTPPAMLIPKASTNPNVAPSVAASPRIPSSPAGTRAAAPGVSSSPAANSNAPSAAASPRVPANLNGSSVAAASPRIPSSPAPVPSGASVTAASPRIPVSPASNPVAASPRIPSPPALNPHGSSVAASPRIPSSPALNPSVAASPRVPSSPALNPPVVASPPKAPRAPSPQSASIASSPRTMGGASPSPPQKAPSPRRASRASSPSIGSTPWPASSPSPQKPAAPPPQKPSSPSMPHPRRRRQQSFKHGAMPIRIEGPAYYDTPADEKEDSDSADYVPIEKEVRFQEVNKEAVAEVDEEHWGLRNSSLRRSSNSRRRLEPRRVVTSMDADDMFCLKKSLSMRNGQTIKSVDSSSTTDDDRESITPRSSRRSMGRTIKPLVWRSRSVQPREDSD